jgi:NAD-dependent deacetylase
MKKILVFSGAGIDKESGIETFRDSDGLWNNYKIEDVATIEAWKRDKKKVLDFYNNMRKGLDDINPNKAHNIIVELEKYFDVTVVTQNVTDLHRRAGSSKVIHLHGELKKSKSTFPGSTERYDCLNEINIGDKCSRGSQLRHDICFFGEDLDNEITEKSVKIAGEVDVCIIVGTSMNVAPANLIPHLTKETCLLYYVDPSDNWEPPNSRKSFYTHIKEPATSGMEKVKEELLEIFK